MPVNNKTGPSAVIRASTAFDHVLRERPAKEGVIRPFVADMHRA
jgi:hypothetical protein